GVILFPAAQAQEVLGGYGEVAADAGDELSVVLGMISLPDGASALMLAPAWNGDLVPGEGAMGALRLLGTPIHAQVAPTSYRDLTAASDSRLAEGLSHAVETRWTPALTPEVAASLVEAAWERTSQHSAIILQHFRGAAARVPLEDTAFGLRS